jgi:hypothetical protein
MSLNYLRYSWNDPIIHQLERLIDISDMKEKTLEQVPCLDKSRIDSGKSIQIDINIMDTR